MKIPFWEWAVRRDAQGASVGLSKTRYGAMTALSRALAGSGRPGATYCGELPR